MGVVLVEEEEEEAVDDLCCRCGCFCSDLILESDLKLSRKVFLPTTSVPNWRADIEIEIDTAPRRSPFSPSVDRGPNTLDFVSQQ